MNNYWSKLEFGVEKKLILIEFYNLYLEYNYKFIHAYL